MKGKQHFAIAEYDVHAEFPRFLKLCVHTTFTPSNPDAPS